MPQYPPITPPGVAVSISYPGPAPVVGDTVAAADEQQVMALRACCTCPRRWQRRLLLATVTFDIGTDLKQQLGDGPESRAVGHALFATSVQNRASPSRKKTPDIEHHHFYSPDGRYENLPEQLCPIHVLERVAAHRWGSQINYQGVGNYSIRAG